MWNASAKGEKRVKKENSVWIERWIGSAKMPEKAFWAFIWIWNFPTIPKDIENRNDLPKKKYWIQSFKTFWVASGLEKLISANSLRPKIGLKLLLSIFANHFVRNFKYFICWYAYVCRESDFDSFRAFLFNTLSLYLHFSQFTRILPNL